MRNLVKVLNWVFILAVVASLIFLRVDYQKKLDGQLVETEKALKAVQYQMIENKEQLTKVITNMDNKVETLTKECNQLRELIPSK